MQSALVRSQRRSCRVVCSAVFGLAGCCALLLALSFSTRAQEPAQPRASQEPATQRPAEISEGEIRHLLMDKPLFLRGGYLDDNLHFDDKGQYTGKSTQGSHTLCGIEVIKVRLTGEKLEVEGLRYALHFSPQLVYEDPTKAVDRIRITPRKKVVRVSIDRMKAEGGFKIDLHLAWRKNKKGRPSSTSASATRPPSSSEVLRQAIDTVFAQGIDDRMIAELPDFWKFYYQAAVAKADYRPTDPAVIRQGAVDQKARLVTAFEPESNEFAQANGIVGVGVYHTVVGTDGRAHEIVVGRPIGFGLDENAAAAIRKGTFQPAIKDGKPVPVLLEMVVQFRIRSGRTAVQSKPEAVDDPTQPKLPGPYSVPHS